MPSSAVHFCVTLSTTAAGSQSYRSAPLNGFSSSRWSLPSRVGELLRGSSHRKPCRFLLYVDVTVRKGAASSGGPFLRTGAPHGNPWRTGRSNGKEGAGALLAASVVRATPPTLPKAKKVLEDGTKEMAAGVIAIVPRGTTRVPARPGGVGTRSSRSRSRRHTRWRGTRSTPPDSDLLAARLPAVVEMRKPHTERRRKHVLTSDEIRAMWEALDRQAS